MSELHLQLSRGFSVLQCLEQIENEELIPTDPPVSLIFHLWERCESKSPFPVLLDIRHPLHADSVLPVRVITKDPQEEWKAKFREAMPPFAYKTYSVTRWSKKFKTANVRRELIKETRLFVADNRIGHILGKILGADFFVKKKTPVLIDLTGDDVVAPILRVLECTTAVLPKSYLFGVPIGRLSWDKDDIADNGCDAIEGIFQKLGKEKVATVYIRVPGSVTVPVYTDDISRILLEEE
jgi:ribosome biogenesis protein UTP30